MMKADKKKKTTIQCTDNDGQEKTTDQELDEASNREVLTVGTIK